MSDTSHNYGSPIGNEVNEFTFLSQQLGLENKIKTYRNKPYLFKIYLVLCTIFAITSLIFCVFIIHLYDPRVLLLAFFPLGFYLGYVWHLQEQLILYLVCQKNNWAYNPQIDRESVSEFITLFPQVFDKGYSQYLDQQIWGEINKNNETIAFWKGVYTYTTGSGRNSSVHHQSIFVLKLDNFLTVDFVVEKTGFIGEFKEKFEDTIQTESEDFNKNFKITSSNDIDSKKQIIKILSPSVQVRLIDFSNKYEIRKIVFAYNTIIFVFKKEIWKVKYTNFFKRFAVDERDEEVFSQSLLDMVKIPSEMIQFL